MGPYVPKELVAERLPLIFPEGITNRSYCTRDLAASTVFVMLYVDSVEGSDQHLGPKQSLREQLSSVLKGGAATGEIMGSDLDEAKARIQHLEERLARGEA